MSRIPKILRQARPAFRSSPRHSAELPKQQILDSKRIGVAGKYFLTDLHGAVVPATRLGNILDNLEQGHRLSDLSQKYLLQQGLVALQQLGQGEIGYEAFCVAAAAEQAKREEAAEAERNKAIVLRSRLIEEEKAREAIRVIEYERERQRADDARRKRESDPKYIAKVKSQQLRMRYGLDDFIDRAIFPRVMDILHRIDDGSRLTDEDVLWLTTEGKDYYTENLKSAFHEREAAFFTAAYNRTSDPWNAVNASGHYRKCSQSGKAHELLAAVVVERQKSPKLKSAICTTHGGAMRDLKHYDEALQFGMEAHVLTPRDFRPCTLLGAVNFEIGNYDAGRNWYEKATERGASERSIDFELRGILIRAEQSKREEIRDFLLREDPVRYSWVQHFKV
jgi:hypothetical protein